eukprot:CAMPEP_0194206538 /NCGR_PEP_ID=MMETSP0156-20130528/5533_1 /TAXON_ID=33649 /ORGANISM="Thalassionema nitzschioides, Strain L26-B" /LENGTH=425 /DNA_ID=CAMNT_0038933079 /DNA_START=29 /DNA_END=1303 /DNA_ORIENTATION=-
MTKGSTLLPFYYLLNTLAVWGRITDAFLLPNNAKPLRLGENLHSSYKTKTYFNRDFSAVGFSSSRQQKSQNVKSDAAFGYCHSLLFQARVSGDHWTAGNNLRKTIFQKEMGETDRYSDGNDQYAGQYGGGGYGYDSYGGGDYDRGTSNYGFGGRGFGFPNNQRYDDGYELGSPYTSNYGNEDHSDYSRRNDYGGNQGSLLNFGGNRRHENRGYNDYDRGINTSYRSENMEYGPWEDGSRNYDQWYGDEGKYRGRGGMSRRGGSMKKKIAFSALSCFVINNVVGTIPMLVYLLLDNAISTKNHYDRWNGPRPKLKKTAGRFLISNMISCTYAAWGWFLASEEAFLPPLSRGRWKTFSALYGIYFFVVNKIRKSERSKDRIAAALQDRRMSWSSANQVANLILFACSVVAMATGIYLAGVLTGIPIW